MSVEVLLVVFVGVCLGSLVNAVVWRVHKQAEIDESKTKDKKAAKRRYSVVTARSMCPHCKHELAAKDLVPILSWLSLRGRCRYCRAPISAQYPIVEGIGALLAGVSYVAWPYDIAASPVHAVAFVLWLVLLTLLLALAVYDVRWRLLPNKLVLPVTIAGVALIVLLAIAAGDLAIVRDAAFGGLLLAGFFYVLFQVSGGRWIGGGDVKLAFLLGLLAGSPLHAVLLLFIASVLGTIYAVLQALLTRTNLGGKTEIAFGPWLILAGFITFLWAADILATYYILLGVQ